MPARKKQVLDALGCPVLDKDNHYTPPPVYVVPSEVLTAITKLPLTGVVAFVNENAKKVWVGRSSNTQKAFERLVMRIHTSFVAHPIFKDELHNLEMRVHLSNVPEDILFYCVDVVAEDYISKGYTLYNPMYRKVKKKPYVVEENTTYIKKVYHLVFGNQRFLIRTFASKESLKRFLEKHTFLEMLIMSLQFRKYVL